MSQDGTIEKVILDVGGFLGIGEREVAVTFDELQIIRNEDGSDLRVYVAPPRKNWKLSRTTSLSKSSGLLRVSSPGAA